jgi:methanol--5-hydroxybenzimidazolylcobamide Co-methyltransferase
MNVALRSGNEKILRDMLVASDKYRDPQSYILAYDNAYKIGQAIVKDGNDLYLRAKNAAVECCNLLTSAEDLEMTRFEINALQKAKSELDALTADADKFMDDCMSKYKAEIKVFMPENYGL